MTSETQKELVQIVHVKSIKKMYINIVYIIHIILFFINTILFCEPTDLDQDSGPGGGVSV